MLRIEDLNLNGLKIYQDDELYHFTSDAIILSRFAKVKKGDLVADFCAGSGIVGLHLYGLNMDKIKEVHLFEIQEQMCEIAKKSIEINDLNDKFRVFNCDLSVLPTEFNGKYSLITCNPPYATVDSSEQNKNESLAISKTELKIDLERLIKSVSRALKFGGRFCLVHRIERTAEIIYQMIKNGIEPKIIQPVSAKNKQPYIVLIEGVKGGKTGVKMLNTLIN
jgi:tRNA1(Val) A37 N6-methylase TrmN6